MGERKEILTYCTLCYHSCGTRVTVEDGKAVQIEGLESHPLNRGGLCPKGANALENIYSPDRLKSPLKRVSGGFEEISWDQALEEIAGKLMELKTAYGPEILGVFSGSIGVETGMYLAENGHKVTVLEMQDVLAYDATPIHYVEMFCEAWEKLENFNYILQARCNGIEKDKVTYIDAEGNEKFIQADSVVIAVGMKSRSDKAMEFLEAADRFFMIGDCAAVGNIQKVMRSAFSTASML